MRAEHKLCEVNTYFKDLATGFSDNTFFMKNLATSDNTYFKKNLATG